MTTKNARYTVTVDPEIANFLNCVSKEKKKSVSSLIQELIHEAIDLREDFYWSRVAEDVEKRAEGKQRIPAEVLWKELGLA